MPFGVTPSARRSPGARGSLGRSGGAARPWSAPPPTRPSGRRSGQRCGPGGAHVGTLQGRLRGLRLGEIRRSADPARWLRSRRASTARCCCAGSSSEGSSHFRRHREYPNSRPAILERREADNVVEALAAIILASRPPRRRSMPAQTAMRSRWSCPAGRCVASPGSRSSSRLPLWAAVTPRQLSRSTIIAIPWPPPRTCSSRLVASAVWRSLAPLQRIPRARVIPEGVARGRWRRRAG